MKSFLPQRWWFWHLLSAAVCLALGFWARTDQSGLTPLQVVLFVLTGLILFNGFMKPGRVFSLLSISACLVGVGYLLLELFLLPAAAGDLLSWIYRILAAIVLLAVLSPPFAQRLRGVVIASSGLILLTGLPALLSVALLAFFNPQKDVTELPDQDALWRAYDNPHNHFDHPLLAELADMPQSTAELEADSWPKFKPLFQAYLTHLSEVGSPGYYRAEASVRVEYIIRRVQFAWAEALFKQERWNEAFSVCSDAIRLWRQALEIGPNGDMADFVHSIEILLRLSLEYAGNDGTEMVLAEALAIIESWPEVKEKLQRESEELLLLCLPKPPRAWSRPIWDMAINHVGAEPWTDAIAWRLVHWPFVDYSLAQTLYLETTAPLMIPLTAESLAEEPAMNARQQVMDDWIKVMASAETNLSNWNGNAVVTQAIRNALMLSTLSSHEQLLFAQLRIHAAAELLRRASAGEGPAIINPVTNQPFPDGKLLDLSDFVQADWADKLHGPWQLETTL
ncbi:MAG: hypothetical protein ACFCU3_08285 [Verrucomicrobiales bacterium]